MLSQRQPFTYPLKSFCPSNEGFIAAYHNRELPFDETYYDLSVALNALPLRSEKLLSLQGMIHTLARNHRRKTFQGK